MEKPKTPPPAKVGHGYKIRDEIPWPPAQAMDAGIQATVQDAEARIAGTPADPGAQLIGVRKDPESEFLDWVADRLVHVYKESENIDFVRHLRALAKKLPSPPKPFTPNKYTRDLLALDGRMVPVDVYSVSGAFALAPVIQSEEVLDALFHARKKILAPGQRGAKGVLQDLKEARQSLDRAIRVMEGG